MSARASFLALAAAALAVRATAAYEPTAWQVTAGGHAQGVRMNQVKDELKAFADLEGDLFEAAFGGSADRTAVPAAYALGGGFAVDYRVARRALVGMRIEGVVTFAYATVTGEGDLGEFLSESWWRSFSALPILFGGRWEFGDPDDVTYGLGCYLGPTFGRGQTSDMMLLDDPVALQRSEAYSIRSMRAIGLGAVVTAETALRVSNSLSLVLEGAYRRSELSRWKYDDAVGGSVVSLGKPLKIGFTGFGLSLATRWHF